MSQIEELLPQFLCAAQGHGQGQSLCAAQGQGHGQEREKSILLVHFTQPVQERGRERTVY